LSFFEPLPPPPEPEWAEEPRRPWLEKPDNAVPGVVPAQLLLARSDTAAVVVAGLAAYPDGVEFDLRVVWRRRGEGMPLFSPRFRAGEDVLRFGVAFADGRRATNLDRRPVDAEPEGVVLVEGGGGGSDVQYTSIYWLWPLPPAGPVAFVCEWPAQGIAETRVEIDAALVLDAAARAQTLWPERPRRHVRGWVTRQVSASTGDDE
jgi:hypothetical protein